ncbi:cell division protein ZapA [Thiohalomonas denitrificans]|uniref:Cell division protein ZapA n=1 Tax=Thiohalomonas denitrificans TaxID=415747 RepID=A0A1G5QGZ8_9GAMM|nr:cell division protein ZapA [Thiohalomonas denitrificans]SCZ60856.1 cell division protein ZapA [Thiohalomonas denitrificans]
MHDPIEQKVVILGKEFLVGCPPEEKEALHESARLLDRKMREIKDSGKVIGSERIAVMAALNIAHELIEERSIENGCTRDLGERLRVMQDKIETALEREDRQMEL